MIDPHFTSFPHSECDLKLFPCQSLNRFFIANIQSLAPDPSPIDPKDNNTATLRLAPPFNPYEYAVEQEYVEHSVLSGLALMGGIWTSLNGVFAMVFGSTLLLVLFGALH